MDTSIGLLAKSIDHYNQHRLKMSRIDRAIDENVPSLDQNDQKVPKCPTLHSDLSLSSARTKTSQIPISKDRNAPDSI